MIIFNLTLLIIKCLFKIYIKIDKIKYNINSIYNK